MGHAEAWKILGRKRSDSFQEHKATTTRKYFAPMNFIFNQYGSVALSLHRNEDKVRANIALITAVK